MIDRADPHARDRALAVAHRKTSFGLSAKQAVTAIEELLGSIGDTCPECPPGAD